ncbi:hypothetical protein Val02_91610 [Virgisporangium aliadipatigenens]|uniref:Glycosyltransferase n=1 Tax=Virgisporangium aliadipatigenens TaxID=741659 RepID=A0A8J3YYV7_9ACTN|nr:glycosyltransferase family 4 protein [Virgisporangium aliadipatigenens]GIJ52275.1 hypothetical protein Val02_91610 [Virgisporangium aliadipatigenens]
MLSRAQFDQLADAVGAQRVHQPTDAWNRLRTHITPGAPVHRLIARPARATRPATRPRPERQRVEPRVVTHLELRAARRLSARLDALAARVRPDAVHALRIQYEGIAALGTTLPLAVSTWGSDLIVTGRSDPRLGAATRAVLRRADVLFSDCARDVDLANRYGLRAETATAVVPGNFGVPLERFPAPDPALPLRFGLRQAPLVVYPRGVRGFVNHTGFLAAARELVADGVDASFLGVGIDAVAGAEAEIAGRIRCTGQLPLTTMLDVAAASAVTVSPSLADGIPNSVLEGMAGGAIPVCGPLESLRELEHDGAVMVWCDAYDTASIASAVRTALQLAADPANRERNRTLIAERYSTRSALHRVARAYGILVPH